MERFKLFPLCSDMLGLATNPIPIKTVMRLLGRDTGELRLPMTLLEESQIRSTPPIEWSAIDAILPSRGYSENAIGVRYLPGQPLSTSH